ncbi:MAG: VCBS repeat-containing protein [Phycisphaerales bacterium]|nr:VCBS repeat-containing protein [Phycisphaerales bacterium]
MNRSNKCAATLAAGSIAALAGAASAQCDAANAFVSPPTVLNNASGHGTSTGARFLDVTGNGHLDLLVGQSKLIFDVAPDRAGIAVFPGDGQGGFGTPFLVGVEGSANPSFTRGGPRSIAGGDLTGNGHTDIVAGTQGVEFIRNNGDGTFADPVVFYDTGPGEGINDLDIADLNGNGHLDIIATDTGGATVLVAYNDGQGNFNLGNAEFLFSLRPTAARAGDFNNNGRLDIAVANSQTQPPSVTLYLNNGNGTFTSAGDFPLTAGPEDLGVGDFDNDGNLDVVVTLGGGGGGVSILYGDGAGGFAPAEQVTIPGTNFALELAVGDIDGDGTDDIAIGMLTTGGDGALGVLLSNGDRTFREGLAISTGLPRKVDLGDLNGNGRLEATHAISSGADNTPVFENGCVDICIADINGDGVVDADDFFAFLALFAAGDLQADINGDGVIDADDFFEYLALFAAGC